MTSGITQETEAPRTSPRLPPLISIVIPALRADAELRRCVDSVRVACSDHARCEVLVVLPQRELKEARRWLPEEILVAERHSGIYGAMNDGAAASSGHHLYFLGKDDIVLPAFNEALAMLEMRNASALFFDVYWGSAGIFSGRPSRWRLLTQNLCHQGAVYSRESFSKHGPYLRKMRVQADHLLNIRLLWDRSTAPNIFYIDRPLAWYSGAGFSVQTARDPVFWRLYPATLRRYVGGWAACLLIASRKLRGR